MVYFNRILNINRNLMGFWLILMVSMWSSGNTWTTLWSFRSFFKQNTVLFHIVNNNWTVEVLHISKTKYPFWMYPYKLWFHCPLTIKKSVSQKSQNYYYYYFLSKWFITKKSTKGNRIGVAPFLQGETCTCNERRFPQIDRLEIQCTVCANRAI